MSHTAVESKIQLGQLLVARRVVTIEQVEEALAEQERTGHRQLLGEILIDKGYCTANHVAAALAECYGVPYAKISPKICDPKVLDILPREFCEEHVVLPLFRVHNTLTLAINEPANLFLIDQIEHLSGYKVQVVCATAKDILATLRAYSPTANVFVIADTLEDKGLEDFSLVEPGSAKPGQLTDAANQSTIIDMVNYLLCDAVRENAACIHIEPDDKSLRVRYRVDGKLSEKMRPPYQMHAAIVSRIKIMAGLDVAQHRLSQEGSIRVMVDDRPVDLRVSIMPGSWGEKVAVRVVDPQRRLMGLESLGFTIENLRRFRQLIQAPYGLVLVTGPAGSGKKTTLRAVISELNRDDVNVCTVEDPLECNIAGVNQFEVNTWMGGEFARTLRHVLRQDPDVVMISEIRDQETANTAVQAALTGCLVLSTLYTHNAPLAVRRLLDLNVPSYLVGDALVGILSQRLVRKVCPNCKQEYEPHISIQRTVEKWLNASGKFYRGMGCRKCRNTGYLGRIAIHELFVPSEEILDMIAQIVTLKQLREAALKNRMAPLHIDGVQKVVAGITTIDEILRVTSAPE
jgi:type IV pilus assembly protein PilB